MMRVRPTWVRRAPVIGAAADSEAAAISAAEAVATSAAAAAIPAAAGNTKCEETGGAITVRFLLLAYPTEEN
jgi:hypothetical protein